jgi:hypothetical protein
MAFTTGTSLSRNLDADANNVNGLTPLFYVPAAICKVKTMCMLGFVRLNPACWFLLLSLFAFVLLSGVQVQGQEHKSNVAENSQSKKRHSDEFVFDWLLCLQHSGSGKSQNTAWRGDFHFSELSILFSMLANENVALEIELTKAQRVKVVRLLAEYDRRRKEIKKMMADGEAEHDFLVDQVETYGGSIDKRINHVLLPHQVNTLKRVHSHYVASMIGYGRALRHFRDAKSIEVSDASLEQFAKREKALLPELIKETREFTQAEIDRVSQLLSEEQKQVLLALIKETRIVGMPELICAHAELGSRRGEFAKIPDRDFAVWTFNVWWILGLDGTLVPQGRDRPGELMFLLADLNQNSHVKNCLGLTAIQDQEIRDLYDAYSKRQDAVMKRWSESSGLERTRISDQWSKERDTGIRGSLDDILLPHQFAAIREIEQLMKFRREGMYESLINGSLGKKLNLSEEVKKKIREISSGVPDRYSRFSKKTSQWFLEELFDSIENAQDRKVIKECFDPSFKVIQTPIGCLLYGIAVRMETPK